MENRQNAVRPSKKCIKKGNKEVRICRVFIVRIDAGHVEKNLFY